MLQTRGGQKSIISIQGGMDGAMASYRNAINKGDVVTYDYIL